MRSLAYLGFHDLHSIDNMTMREYQIRTEAYLLKREEEDRKIYLQAFINQVAKSTEGEGDNMRPAYPTFTDLYDEQARIDSIREAFEPGYKPQAAKKIDQNAVIAKRAREYQRMKKMKRMKRKGGENVNGN